MKTLVLVRHAKSSHDDPFIKDIDRPLNHRGKRDAPVMAHFLNQSNIIPDCILSSPATRAHITAAIFAQELLGDESRVDVWDEIYDAPAKQLMSVIKQVDDANRVCMLVGHNPGLTDLANHLIKVPRDHIDNIPTTGVVILELGIGTWIQLTEAIAVLSRFVYPKLIQTE